MSLRSRSLAPSEMAAHSGELKSNWAPRARFLICSTSHVPGQWQDTPLPLRTSKVPVEGEMRAARTVLYCMTKVLIDNH